MTEIEKLFIKDLVCLLKEKNEESKLNGKNDPLEMERHMAYFDVLSIIHFQAIAFNINPADIGLGGFNPDRDAL